MLRVGRSVLDDPVDEDAKTLLVGQYVETFERWYREEGPGNPNASTTREHLEFIQSLILRLLNLR